MQCGTCWAWQGVAVPGRVFRSGQEAGVRWRGRLLARTSSGLFSVFCCCPSECTGQLQTHKPLAALRACSTRNSWGRAPKSLLSAQDFRGLRTPDGLMGFPTRPASLHFASRQKQPGEGFGGWLATCPSFREAKGSKKHADHDQGHRRNCHCSRDC